MAPGGSSSRSILSQEASAARKWPRQLEPRPGALGRGRRRLATRRKPAKAEGEDSPNPFPQRRPRRVMGSLPRRAAKVVALISRASARCSTIWAEVHFPGGACCQAVSGRPARGPSTTPVRSVIPSQSTEAQSALSCATRHARNLGVNLLRRHPIAIALVAFSSSPHSIPATAGGRRHRIRPGDVELERPALYTVLAPMSDTLDASPSSASNARAGRSSYGRWGSPHGARSTRSVRRRVSLALAGRLGSWCWPAPRCCSPARTPPRRRRLRCDDHRLSRPYRGVARRPIRLDVGPARRLACPAGVRGELRHRPQRHFQPAHYRPDPAASGSRVERVSPARRGLGPVRPIARDSFGTSTPRMLRLFGELERQGAVGIASLPEYWRNHFEDLDAFVAAGADGFEIVNCAPRRSDFRAPAARGAGAGPAA